MAAAADGSVLEPSIECHMSRGGGAARRLWVYLTRDLREIAFPSSLPDPPLAAGEQAGHRKPVTPGLLLKARQPAQQSPWVAPSLSLSLCCASSF